jgi:hypothetical protein
MSKSKLFLADLLPSSIFDATTFLRNVVELLSEYMTSGCDHRRIVFAELVLELDLSLNPLPPIFRNGCCIGDAESKDGFSESLRARPLRRVSSGTSSAAHGLHDSIRNTLQLASSSDSDSIHAGDFVRHPGLFFREAGCCKCDVPSEMF